MITKRTYYKPEIHTLEESKENSLLAALSGTSTTAADGTGNTNNLDPSINDGGDNDVVYSKNNRIWDE